MASAAGIPCPGPVLSDSWWPGPEPHAAAHDARACEHLELFLTSNTASAKRHERVVSDAPHVPDMKADVATVTPHCADP